MSSSSELRSRWIAVAFAALALVTHLYLALQSYQLKLGSGAKSVCNVNATFNCDAVALSRFAELFGIPMAVWGAAFNLVLLIFLVIGAFDLASPRSRVDRISWTLAGISALASVAMGGISMVSLGTYCLFCIAAYVFSFVIFFLVHKFREKQGSFSSDFASLFQESKGLGILIVAFPVLAFGFNKVALVEFGFEQNQWRVTESINVWQGSPEQNFPPEFGVKYKSNLENPKITLLEFADFLCPHCKSAAGPLHAFADAHPDVQLIFIPFPLDGSCNPAIPNKGDGLRCNLAAAMLCADKLSQKGFLAHDFIFDQQTELTTAAYPQDMKELAEKLGITPENLLACIDSAETKDQISKGADLGGKAKIMGTPAVFANGKKLDNGQYYPVLEALYRRLK